MLASVSHLQVSSHPSSHSNGISFSVEPTQQIQGSLQSLNIDSLLKYTFIPDYSVRAITEVFYVAIKRTLYLAAKRATLMERSKKYGELGSNEPIDDEVEKVRPE